MTIVPYANSLDPDETLSNSASHPDSSYLKLKTYSPALSIRKHFEIEADEKN